MRTMTDDRPGHIHGRISYADDGHPVAQVVGIRVCQIVDGKMDISQGLSLHSQGFGTPNAGSDEDALITVPEQILNLQGAADGGVGTDFDSDFQQFLFVPLQNGFRQTEFRNSILKYAANFISGVKNRHTVALLGQHDGDGNARRTGADHRHLLPVPGRTFHLNPLKASIGNIVLDAADMNRLSFSSQNTVSLALILVIADHRTYQGHGIIFKQHSRRFLQLPLL